MKCFAFFLLFMVSINFSSMSAGYAEQTQSTAIESISYSSEPDDKESVIFKLSGPITDLNVFRLNGTKPRLVIDLPQTFYKGKSAIPVDNRTLAYRIRTGAHTAPVIKTRVVVDLLSQYEITYEKIFSVDNTVLKIVLSPIHIEKLEMETEVAQITVGQGIGIAKTETEETVPPVFAEKVAPVGETVVTDSSDSSDSSDSPEGPEGTEGTDSSINPDRLDGVDGSTGGPQLLEISFDNSSNKGEMVIFRLNDFYPPTVSAIEEETPRVFCDFMDMQLASDVREVILAKGKYVERIRTARHGNPDKIRVVLDLAPDRDYDLQQVFFKNDNLFVLIVNELPKVVSD